MRTTWIGLAAFAFVGCSTTTTAVPPPPVEGIISISVEAFGME